MNPCWVMFVSIGVLFLGDPKPAMKAGPSSFDDSPQAIMKKARDAAIAVRRVRYTAEYVATGWVREYVPTVKGAVLVGEQSKWDITKFRSNVKIIPNEKGDAKDDPMELTAGCDGELFYVIDAKTKTFYEDIDPEVMGSHARDIQRVVLSELASPKPYEKELEAKDLTIKSIPEVSGERCFELHATVEDREVVWYIAWSDFLPRRFVRIYKNPEDEVATTQLTLTDLEVNPKLPGNPFKAKVPPGFKKTDEFAP